MTRMMGTDTNILILKSSKKIKRVVIADIAYITCNCSLCDVHFVDGKDFTCSKPLHYFEEVLPSDSFFRINHHTIVCFNQISEVITDNAAHTVMMDDGTDFSISSRKWPGFRDCFLK